MAKRSAAMGHTLLRYSRILLPMVLAAKGRAPSGAGSFLRLLPRVPFAFGELHPWLQPCAPSGRRVGPT